MTLMNNSVVTVSVGVKFTDKKILAYMLVEPVDSWCIHFYTAEPSMLTIGRVCK